jgi:hypothetical protein
MRAVLSGGSPSRENESLPPHTTASTNIHRVAPCAEVPREESIERTCHVPPRATPPRARAFPSWRPGSTARDRSASPHSTQISSSSRSCAPPIATRRGRAAEIEDGTELLGASGLTEDEVRELIRLQEIEFPEYDTDVAQTARDVTCPKCGYRFTP